MHIERLVIEAGANTVTLDLHPQLTVIGGVSDVERDALVGEFLGSLGSGRPGVHLELLADNGKRFAIFRPQTGRHQVIDIDEPADATAAFTDERGEIDLLHRAGLTPESARHTMRIGAADLITTRERDLHTQRLAQVNQNELWVAAEALRQSQRRLDEEARAAGSSVEDVAVIEKIEARHADFEASQVLMERYRKSSFLVSGFATLCVVPAALAGGALATLPLMLIAAASTILSFLVWRRNERAHALEGEALAEAGAQSYLGFHLQRVNGLLHSDQSRKRLMLASEDHRDALRRWQVIAGDVDLVWALEHRDEITAAVRLRQQAVSMGVYTDGDEAGDRERAATLAQALMSRLADLRSVGPGHEAFPALLDEPFQSIEPSIRPSLLELLVRTSAHQQIVLLTEDPATLAWARLEAMTGALGLIQPAAADQTMGTVALPG